MESPEMRGNFTRRCLQLKVTIHPVIVDHGYFGLDQGTQSEFMCLFFLFPRERSHSFHQIIKGSVSPPAERLGIAAVDD